MKKGARWEEIVDRWPFRKAVDHTWDPLGFIYTILGLKAELARAWWPGLSSELATLRYPILHVTCGGDAFSAQPITRATSRLNSTLR
jgi:hypothetical protein